MSTFLVILLYGLFCYFLGCYCFVECRTMETTIIDRNYGNGECKWRIETSNREAKARDYRLSLIWPVFVLFWFLKIIFEILKLLNKVIIKIIVGDR